MRRTLVTGLRIWRKKGLSWPVLLLARGLRNRVSGFPRGLMVEPSQRCTGRCRGCRPPDSPVDLIPEMLESWLSCRPVKPVTIHFSGKHSDPLANPHMKELAGVAGRHCSMVSLSTIGLGFLPVHAGMPVDRWIFSLPAAASSSWISLRGHDRLSEVLTAVEAVQTRGTAMVELVLTLWKQSVGDKDSFRALASRLGAHSSKTVYGLFDPGGDHIGRAENLALESPDCPYELDPSGTPVLKRVPRGCPLSACLFLDAKGSIRPCPFTGDEAPVEPVASRDAWKRAAEWSAPKGERSFAECRFCP